MCSIILKYLPQRFTKFQLLHSQSESYHSKADHNTVLSFDLDRHLAATTAGTQLMPMAGSCDAKRNTIVPSARRTSALFHASRSITNDKVTIRRVQLALMMLATKADRCHRTASDITQKLVVPCKCGWTTMRHVYGVFDGPTTV